MVWRSFRSIFIGGGLALLIAPMTLVLASSAAFSGRHLRPLSTAATMCAVGILDGAGAKYRPLLNTLSSAEDRVLDDRFTTHFG